MKKERDVQQETKGSMYGNGVYDCLQRNMKRKEGGAHRDVDCLLHGQCL